MFAPGTGPSIESFLKSMSQNLGVFASQWTDPPPTVWGRSCDRARDRRSLGRGPVHAGLRDRVRSREVTVHLQLVVREHRARVLRGEIGEVVGAFLEDRDVEARSRQHHRGDRSAGAAADDEGPLAHQGEMPSSLSELLADARRHVGIRPVGEAHLGVGEANGLAVAGPVDLAPADESGVAAVLGHRVHSLDRVPEQQGHESAGVLGEDGVHLLAAEAREVAAAHLVEGLDAFSVLAAERGETRRPAVGLSRRQPEEGGHVVELRAGPIAERPAGKDPRRSERQRPEHGVDVAGHVRLAGAGVPRLCRVVLRTRNQPCGRLLDDAGLVCVEHEPALRARWMLSRRGCRRCAARGEHLGRE